MTKIFSKHETIQHFSAIGMTLVEAQERAKVVRVIAEPAEDEAWNLSMVSIQKPQKTQRKLKPNFIRF